jgi:spore coat polysaccharide biosynthesis protein SpsF (cytidylyltransferase family)
MAPDETILILQARMGSKRYPGKMMEEIAGRPFLDRVLSRLEAAWNGIKVLAIPENDRDEPMRCLAERRGWLVHRGSEEDVLGRFASVLRALKPRAFLRICGDSPLTDPEPIRRLVEALATADAARCSGYPWGMSGEGATTEALLEADACATEPHDREHVMPWLYREAEAGRKRLTVVATDRYPATRRLTVDTAEDVAFFRRLFTDLGDDPTTDAVLAYPGVLA